MTPATHAESSALLQCRTRYRCFWSPVREPLRRRPEWSQLCMQSWDEAGSPSATGPVAWATEARKPAAVTETALLSDTNVSFWLQKGLFWST